MSPFSSKGVGRSGLPMKRFSVISSVVIPLFCGIALETSSAEAADAKDSVLERKPLVIRSYVDFGQVVEGSNQDQSPNGPIEFAPIQRTGITAIQEVNVRQKLNIKVGVGGLFWYPWPQLKESPHTQIVKFGPGIATANGTFKFGDPKDSWMKAQFGFFGYKYNPDAMNLGEYLYRSTTYPGILFTGGWTFTQSEATNNAAYRANGVRFSFSHLDGTFNHDFTAFFETESFPILSLSPGWNGSLKLGKAFEIGGGAVYQHLVPMKPSQLTPKDPLSTYVRLPTFPTVVADTGRAAIDNQPGRAVTNYRGHAGGALEGIEQEIMSMKIANPSDPAELIQPYLAVTNGVDTQYTADPNRVPPGYHFLYAREKEYLTFRGIKVMGRACLDLKPILGLEEALGPSDLKFFVEAAILGIKNQPFYYEDIQKRIPIMAGFNLPTFKLLDILSVQVEHYGMDYLNSEEKSFVNNVPVYQVPNNKVQHHFSDLKTDDDLKWSVYAKRNLFTGLNLYAQAASDHMRLQDFNGRRAAQPVVNGPSEWYYLFRLEFGI